MHRVEVGGFTYVLLQDLILMGDWSVAAQPMIENQECGELNGWEDRFGKEGNTTSFVGFCLFLLTGVANG